MLNDTLVAVRLPSKIVRELRRECSLRGISMSVAIRERLMFSRTIVEKRPGRAVVIHGTKMLRVSKAVRVKAKHPG